MSELIVPLDRVTSHIDGGSKAFNLGQMMRAGLPVPTGYCLLTRAFEMFLGPQADWIRRKLVLLEQADPGAVRRTGEEILRIVEDLHRSGRTVVMVTHDPKVAARTERCIRLRDGRVVEDRDLRAGGDR